MDISKGEVGTSDDGHGVMSTCMTCEVCTGIGNSTHCQARSSSRESGPHDRDDP
jgi:hypothetical protein